ncbi:helix-turn-helix domain-containing protein [Frigoribacterium sp. CFBP 13729]|uniref:helix-turn-helix domain-containing protein n=1 Tax=Frigoribacterium sp. CFBP 13729 TaxID=2775293 RepID=UPI00177D19A5|nr:helix-turn-helix domain-containing protein [Frigoribacterium sp. CFBP 13729]MBD8610028.1 helix-turn-helix domain-containing protein [Frigoribacterium sp. CFBP 13729]
MDEEVGTGATPPPFRGAVHGDDLDAARELYEAQYPGEGFRLDQLDRPFEYRYAAVGDGDVSLRTSEFHGSARGTADAVPEYVLSWLVEGRGTVDVGRDAVELRPLVPRIAPTRAYSFDFSDYRQRLVHVSAAHLERLAAERGDVTSGPVTFFHAAPVGDAALRRWRAVLSETTPVLLDLAAPALLRAEANRRLALAVLETFPHEAGQASAVALAPGAPVAPGARRLALAVEYLHAHAHEPIGVADVARAADLSVRGLQVALQRALDVSPTVLLRQIRLDRVHADLSVATPETATVGSVARRWGFSHLGRFSASYHERFGEHPSVTLRS